jgi:stearoyl-CoA desaturase (Delta-9 desaturase)
MTEETRMNKQDRRLDWGNILFLTLSPALAVAGGVFFGVRDGLHWPEILLFVALFFATGLSITGGYHRHFAHVSYKAHWLMRLFYLVFGACAFENSALNWAADHRLHHRYTDTDKDPYNAGQGFWYSHIGWIFYETPKNRDFTIVGDLLKDPLVRWQHRYHVWIGFVVGMGIPLAIGFAVGRPLSILVWGGVIRVVFTHHATFFINSLAHMWGRQPYGRADSSRDSWWLAFLTNGEGYHNFHHRFPSDYRNGIHWYQWDPTKWLIAGMNWVGLTQKLHRIPAHIVLRARLEVEALDAEKRLQALPQSVGITLREHLEVARQQFEVSLSQWAETRATYWEMKKANSKAAMAPLKAKVKEYEVRLGEARQQWRETLQGVARVPVSSI